MSYAVYIMSNAHHTVFYVGVTSDLEGRVWQHKHGEGGVFTSKYIIVPNYYIMKTIPIFKVQLHERNS